MRLSAPTRPQPRSAEALSSRAPAAAILVDQLDRVVMASEQSVPVLQQLFDCEKADIFGEVPEDFKPKLHALRSGVTSNGTSSLVQVTPVLCMRASSLNDGHRQYLLVLFERMARRNLALHNLQNFGLTPREQEVALVVLYGMSNRAIANRLSITESTVEGYIKRILTKVGVASRAAFVSKILGWGPSGED